MTWLTDKEISERGLENIVINELSHSDMKTEEIFSRLQQLTKQYSELTKQTTGLSLCHFNKMC